MRILVLGAAGFIGTNLALALSQNLNNQIILVDKDKKYFSSIEKYFEKNVKIMESAMDEKTDYDSLLQGQEIVYHLVSTTIPGNSNQHISQELVSNVVPMASFLEACIRCEVKKVIFISSGGTVYGIESNCPLKEDMITDPITSYGMQKVTIEKLLYLYSYLHGLDYCIIRLANPYGPYQRPNGLLGAVTNFTYKALKNEKIQVYGDGSVIRDYIFIDDVISAILKLANKKTNYKIYNLGSGYGTSLNQLIGIIQRVIGIKTEVEYLPKREVDVPVNYLDITRFEKEFGRLKCISLEEGIQRTAEFMKQHYVL